MKHAIIALLLCGGMVVAADDPDSKKLLISLQGSYKATALEKGGDVPPKEFLETLEKISIKGNKFSITFKGTGKSEEKTAIISVDATKKILAIDLKPEDGPEKDKVLQGILEVTGDTVKICWADDEKLGRPTKFETNKENRQFMITLVKTKE